MDLFHNLGRQRERPAAQGDYRALSGVGRNEKSNTSAALIIKKSDQVSEQGLTPESFRRSFN